MKNIKKILSEKSLTYEAFADELNSRIGYEVIAPKSARQIVAKWVSGYRKPSKAKQKMIADFFGITVEELKF